MTSPAAFSPDWSKQFADPYAVLGVAVTADERRIAKRYRQVAKQLHPDQQMDADEATREFANHLLTRLVNPAYQRLKQDKGRSETLATLRFKVRRLTKEQKFEIRGSLAQQLISVDEPEVELFYEKALAELADMQYSSNSGFAQHTLDIAELNLVYLRRKMGDSIIREKRTGLVSATTVPSTVASPPPTAKSAANEPDLVNYAQRHVMRAKTYINSKSYNEAIQELRDAVRIDPHNSDYHAMLGQAYLLQKMAGMAKVHFRQALKLNPKNAVALKYAKQLAMDMTTVNPAPPSNTAAPNDHSQKKAGGFFQFFSTNRSAK